MDETTPTPVPQPESQPEQTPQPAPHVEPAPQAEPVQTSEAAPEPASTEPGITIQPAGDKKPELTPEQKKAARKKALKKVGIVSGIAYGIVLIAIIAWAFITGGEEVGVFDFLPVSSAGFNNFLMLIFNIQMGLLVFAGLGVALFGLIKSFMAKKEEKDKKKKASKIALIGGIAFFVLTTIWLVLIAFIGPKLVTEDRFSSVIQTTPEDTIGLTAPVEIVFDASGVPVDPKVYRVLTYSWDFGDGDSATGEAVSHRYTQKAEGDGKYTVTLEVEYMDLKSGETFDATYTKDIVISNELVAAAFVASPTSGDAPLTVKFDASNSYDADGEIVAYEWDMDGDGRFDDAEGVEVEHEFTQDGEYEVSLRVTDNNGEYDIVSDTISVGSNGGMRAVITAPLPSGETYMVGEKYEFDGADSQIEDGAITKYTWDFGDEDTVQSRSVNHVFEEAGYYTVTLTIQDAQGNSDIATIDIEVAENGAEPQAVIQADPEVEGGVISGPVPLTVTFDGRSSLDPDDDIVDYLWDFGFSGLADESGDQVQVTFNELGTYTTTLTVIDSAGNESEEEVTVQVGEQGIVADLEVDETNGEVPLTVTFNAAGSTYREGNIVSYEYDFGVGEDPYVGGSSVTYKYTEVGNFTATVTVVGDDGSRASDSVQIVVRPVSITACFEVNTTSGQAPLFLSVDPSCSQGTISSYSWDFGDGDVSFDRKPETHTYATAGTYTVTLEVTSDQGVVDTVEKTITVK